MVRKAVDEAIDRPAGDRDRAVAAAVRLIDEHLLRVGNRRSAQHGHYGTTTLTVEHIDERGHVQLDYVAKSGKERSIIVEDDDLADLLVELAQKADNELFWFSADELGNTRAVARSSYIHPIILATDRDVVQAAWKSSRSSKWLDRSESGLIKLLRDH